MRTPVLSSELWWRCKRQYPKCTTFIIEDHSYACLSERDVRAVAKLFRRLQWATSILSGMAAWRWTPRNDCENFSRLAACAASAWYAGLRDSTATAPGWGTLKYRRPVEDFTMFSDDPVVYKGTHPEWHTANVVLTEDGGLRVWEPQERDWLPLALPERLTVTQVIF